MLALVAGCSEGPGPVSVNGVRRFVPQKGVPRRSGVDARAGDLVLDDGRLQVVVSAASRRSGFGREQGAIVDVGVHTLGADALRQLATYVEVDGSRRRVRVSEVVPVEGAVPAVEVRGVVNHRRLRLPVTTIVRLPATADVVEIITRVQNDGDRPATMRVIDEVRWDDAPPFAPGLGRLASGGTFVVPWFARAAEDVSYAYAARWTDSSVRFELHPMPGATRPLDRAVVLGGVATVPPGGKLRAVRGLFAAAGDVARVFAAAARFHRQPLERVRGRTQGLGAGAELAILDAQDRPFLEAELPADGSFAIDLPPGRYALETATYGRLPPPRRTIDVGAGVTPFVLLPALDAPAELTLHVRDAQTGEGLAARGVVRGVSPTADPVLGPPSKAAGAGYAVHTRTGEARVTVPAGRYRVSVSHGPEWTLHGEDLLLRPGAEAVVEAELARVVDTAGLVACDLHLHAAPSPDSQTTLEDRIVSLVAEGIELAAATDHNQVTDYAPVVEALGLAGRIVTIRGDEVTSETPHIGHFNVYPWDGAAGDPGIPFEGQSPVELFAAIREAQPRALLQVNHPWGDNATGYFTLFGYDVRTGRADAPFFDARFDAIEVWNGMWLGDSAIMDASLDGFVAFLVRGQRVIGTGSSDSHHMVNQWAGYPRTYAYVDEDDPARLSADAVVEALRAGRAFVTTGPIVRLEVAGGIPGDAVAAEGATVEAVVRIAAAPWVQVRRLRLWQGAAPADPIDVPLPPAGEPLIFEHRSTLAVAQDGFVLATVEGDVAAREVLPQFGVGPRAFTNPVWVDGDGDGIVTIAGRQVARVMPPAAAPAVPGDAGAATPTPEGDAASADPPVGVDAGAR